MRKLLVVALLAALAPLGVAHAASKPVTTKTAMSGKKTIPVKGTKKSAKKHIKMMSSKKMATRDPKTGRFTKASTTAKSSSTVMAAPAKK